MKLHRMIAALVAAAALAGLAACAGETETAASEADPPRAIVKGGDGRAGEYEAVAGWWKPAPDHDDVWTWGEVSGVAVDTPDRIIVAVWGDRNATERSGTAARTTLWRSTGTATSSRTGRSGTRH